MSVQTYNELLQRVQRLKDEYRVLSLCEGNKSLDISRHLYHIHDLDCPTKKFRESIVYFFGKLYRWVMESKGWESSSTLLVGVPRGGFIPDMSQVSCPVMMVEAKRFPGTDGFVEIHILTHLPNVKQKFENMIVWDPTYATGFTTGSVITCVADKYDIPKNNVVFCSIVATFEGVHLLTGMMPVECRAVEIEGRLDPDSLYIYRRDNRGELVASVGDFGNRFMAVASSNADMSRNPTRIIRYRKIMGDCPSDPDFHRFLAGAERVS